MRAWYRANREQVMANVKAWYHANPERARAGKRAANARRRDLNREDHLRRAFGFSTAEYEAMLAQQGGGCAICRRPPDEARSLHVDHDHGSGQVRGLLCFSCNAGPGQFREDPQRLLEAVAYLVCDGHPTRLFLEERQGLGALFVELLESTLHAERSLLPDGVQGPPG